MVGGEEEAYEKAKPILGMMGKNTGWSENYWFYLSTKNKIVHCGKVGSGQATKHLNNMFLASQMVPI
jgi:3-hydroxyisobutyrate dehydrogenase